MKTVTIVRSRWGKSKLRRKDGKLCCLGFACEAYGVPASVTEGVSYPGYLNSHKELLPTWLLTIRDVEEAAKINDSRRKRERKEALLRPIFRRNGIILRFVD